jgi:hypothetical protein
MFKDHFYFKMNRTYLVFACLIGIVLIIYGSYWYTCQTNSKEELSSPNYVKRLLNWAKTYHSVQLEDITHIQDSRSIKHLFISLKKVPTCRSAKLLAHLYFSIYVERDTKALQTFVSLMKEYYPDSYQWDNAFYWKYAENLLWNTYDTLSKETKKPLSTETKKPLSTETKKPLGTETKKPLGTDNLIKNFKAIVSNSIKEN